MPHQGPLTCRSRRQLGMSPPTCQRHRETQRALHEQELGGSRSQMAFHSSPIRHSCLSAWCSREPLGTSGGPVQLLLPVSRCSLCLPWAPPTPALLPCPSSHGAARRSPSLSPFSKNSHPCHRASRSFPGRPGRIPGLSPLLPLLLLPGWPRTPQRCVDSAGEMRWLQAPGQGPCGLHAAGRQWGCSY